MASALQRFVSNIWTVHRPVFERDAVAVDDDKPAAHLPAPSEYDEEARAHIKNDDDAKQIGVAIAEVTYALTGASWYIMMVSLIFAYFVFSLDNMTTSVYLYQSMTALGGAGDYYTAVAIQGVIVGVAKLIIGKLADIYGRFTAAVVTLFFYVIGYIILAVAQNSTTQIAGVSLAAVGNSGLQIIMWVILADFLSARMRAFGVAIITTPIFVTFAVAPLISASVIKSNWRWGYGMFTILVPATMTPIICFLYYLERKAKRSGLVPVHPYRRHGFMHGLKEFWLDADVVGMVLILAGFVFLLLPLNRGTMVPWNTPWMIALLTVGGVLLLTVPFYEMYVAPRPFVRRSWLNSDVLLAIVIVFFDFMSFQISFQMFFQWQYITLGRSFLDKTTGYLTFTDTLALTFFGIVGGAIIWYTRRFKYLLVIGAAIRLLAFGLMIRYRQQGTSTVQAVFPQILLGLGGAFVGEIVTISSQITVRHQDVAMVTSVVMLFSLIGGSIGTTIYHSIINERLPNNLVKYTGATHAEAVTTAASFSYGPTDRTSALGMAQIRAYNDAAVYALYAGIAFSAFAFLCSFFVKDWILPRSQNVVSDELPEKSPWHMKTDTTYDDVLAKSTGQGVDRYETEPAAATGAPWSAAGEPAAASGAPWSAAGEPAAASGAPWSTSGEPVAASAHGLEPALPLRVPGATGAVP